MKQVLLFFVCTPLLFSQNVILYEGEKINELDADQNKTGLWKVFDMERGLIIMGDMSGDQFTSSVEYFLQGKLFAS